jgi:hypothetical protein
MMNKQRALVLLFAFLCCLVLTSVVSAEMFSDNYGVPWDTRWGGGGLTSSANYAVNGTVGQGAIGWTESDNYGVGAGYWYGAVVEYRIYLPLVMRNYS